MRNLKGVKYEQWKTARRPVTAATWDAEEDCAVCTAGPTEDDALVELFRIDNVSKSQYKSPCQRMAVAKSTPESTP